MAKRGPKGKKRKRVTVQFLKRTHAGKVTEPYEIMEKIIADCRADLSGVKIGIAWRLGWRADPDGYMQMGKCRKRGDLDRELDDYDFIILFNKEAWPTLERRHKERWMLHELEHAQICTDSNGEPKKDDRGRLVCRIKKHDFEEFRCVVEKYGLRDDLMKLAIAGMNDSKRPLLSEADKKNKNKSMQQSVTEAENGAA